MRTQNNILVLDTETVGNFSQPLIHDMGYAILDKNLKVVVSKRFLIKETRLAKWVLDYSKFYKSKAYIYDLAIEEDAVKIIGWKKFLQIFSKDLILYNVKTISSYNIAFDYRALEFTNEFFCKPINLMKKINSRKILCIWNLATDTVMQSNNYKQWAIANDKISKNNNILTNADSCYGYLTNNTNFKEEHTALKDSLISAFILKYIIINYKGNFDYGLKYNCWSKIKG